MPVCVCMRKPGDVYKGVCASGSMCTCSQEPNKCVCVSMSGCIGRNSGGGLPGHMRAYAGLWMCVSVWDRGVRMTETK